MGFWTLVTDSQSSAPITNAYFNKETYNNGDGWYWLNATIWMQYWNPLWCDADGYLQTWPYFSGDVQFMQIALDTAMWPAT